MAPNPRDVSPGSSGGDFEPGARQAGWATGAPSARIPRDMPRTLVIWSRGRPGVAASRPPRVAGRAARARGPQNPRDSAKRCAAGPSPQPDRIVRILGAKPSKGWGRGATNLFTAVSISRGKFHGGSAAQCRLRCATAPWARSRLIFPIAQPAGPPAQTGLRCSDSRNGDRGESATRGHK